MNSENRDFIIERLERQLKEKEAEIEDIKTTLRDSILREIRSDLKSDLDINNRIVQLEQKVQAMTSNLNGIMDELLDQKSMIRSLGELSVSQHMKEEVKPEEVKLVPEKTVEKTEPRLYRPENEPAIPKQTPDPAEDQLPPMTPVITAPVKPYAPPEMPVPASRVNSKVSIRSTDETEGSPRSAPAGSPANVSFNVRDAGPAVVPKVQEPEPPSEYIVAETDDEREMRNMSQGQGEPCDYIVAEEQSARRQTESEYETVEAREDEDAVITITRRK
ncbi:hypothetical protein V7O62_07995 [Methanolobus sp. ZRKC2]|uniref:hypothetical protein n=1 Tax=Methanolobus sp. ZRKC2 TaxID=3125783 RepID=UPI003255F9BB